MRLSCLPQAIGDPSLRQGQEHFEVRGFAGQRVESGLAVDNFTKGHSKARHEIQLLNAMEFILILYLKLKVGAQRRHSNLSGRLAIDHLQAPSLPVRCLRVLSRLNNIEELAPEHRSCCNKTFSSITHRVSPP